MQQINANKTELKFANLKRKENTFSQISLASITNLENLMLEQYSDDNSSRVGQDKSNNLNSYRHKYVQCNKKNSDLKMNFREKHKIANVIWNEQIQSLQILFYFLLKICFSFDNSQREWKSSFVQKRDSKHFYPFFLYTEDGNLQFCTPFL